MIARDIDLLTFLYGLPQKYKGLIDRDGMRDKPAVVYPASKVGSLAARADMESASPKRQSLQAASGLLPEELSASSGVGVPLVAMMGDQSLCKGRLVKGNLRDSSRHRKRGAFRLFIQTRHDFLIRLAVTPVWSSSSVFCVRDRRDSKKH